MQLRTQPLKKCFFVAMCHFRVRNLALFAAPAAYTKGASTMGNTFDTKLDYKLGGVSSISGTLASVSGAFPTFAIQFIVFPLY